MPSDRLIEELATLFRETEAAHAEAFAASDGEDEEWPLWYAEYLQAPLGNLLNTSFTKSELVWALVEAQREFEEEQEEDWPLFYADFFEDTYSD